MNENLIDNVLLNFDARSQWILNIALAFVMFGIALEISMSDFKRVANHPKSIVVGVVSQFLVLPFVTFLLVYFIEPLPSIAMGMFMVAACPGGNVSNFITHLAGGNTALSISLTAMATLLAVIMTPLNLQLWAGMYAPTDTILKNVAISPWKMVQLVALLLGLPLFLGLLINHLRPNMALRIGKVLKMVSLLFFVLLIFMALYNNKEIFMEYVLYVFWLVVLHNLVAFSTGFSIAKLFKLPSKDVRSITVETGIQNSGLGLLLIFSFFDGLGGMAILAAFWGIWHLISGLLLAAFWNYRPINTEKLV
ncbi:bile acid:sodium symporter family protein [Cytophaga sp. FL35]|uniref:bile acid:sodium symporter family protein n=1 Tax=Cytophaga sp. FL35 TaxID=1904456 RepID=UPI001653A41F|nr:bile acid:sodium symporter family protein [Cytophaga sp. FL35]MBC6998265.1 bile acid:sodium symporter family protein [Cytophaga sp. FL35]